MNSCVDIKLFRGATDLGKIIHAMGYTATATNSYFSTGFEFLDSPATTSATTYKTQFANNVSAAFVGVQPENFGRSTITLMEIAA
jgi:hypothetical protein